MFLWTVVFKGLGRRQTNHRATPAVESMRILKYHCTMHINCSPLYFHRQTIARKFSDHG